MTRRTRQSILAATGLSVVAVSQPILDLLSKNGETLIAHHTRGGSIIVLALVLTFGPPMILATVLAGAYSRSAAFGTVVTRLVVTTLGAALALQVLVKIADPPAPLAAGLALTIGLLLAIARERTPEVRVGLALLAASAVVCPTVFLLTPSVRGLVRANPTHDYVLEPATPDPRAQAAGAPVVFILLDELPLISLLDRDGTINHRRYPNFARLASQSHWFRNATTVAQSTVFSLPAMLTGRDPDIRRLPTAAQYPLNLFTILHAGGYTLAVEEPLTDLCPPDWCGETTSENAAVRIRGLLRDLALVYAHILLPNDWRQHLPPVDQAWAHFTTGDTTGDESPDAFIYRHAPGLSFVRFTDSIQARPTPTLYFLHVLLPHLPWLYLPSGKRFDITSLPPEPHGLRDERWQGTVFETVQAYQLHLLQLAYTDKLLGQMLDRLQELGLLDASLLVVTADHGASFQSGKFRRKLTAQNQAEIANVPLFIKVPNQRQGVVDDRNVMTIDLLPTLATAVGMPLNGPIDGHDLFANDDPLTSRGEQKWTFATGGRGGGIGERFVYDQRQLAAQRERFVARKRAWFGRAPRRLYAIGPHRKLVGRPLDQLAVDTRPADGTSRVDQAGALAALDRQAHRLPARLTGRLDGFDPAEAPEHLAVALHGVVQATVMPYRDLKGALRFSAVVGEHALRDGNNPVTLLAIYGPPGSDTLARIEIDGS